MGKITVKHYLNKDLKPISNKGINKYPVYVQIFVLAKSLRLKSTNNYFEYLSEEDFQDPTITDLLSREKRDIEKVVGSLIENDEIDLITSKNISFFIQNPIDLIETNFPKLLEKESEETGVSVPDIMLHASYMDIRELINFFYNPEPVENIGTEVKNCLTVLEIIWTDIYRGYFLAYDFFYGEKYRNLITSISIAKMSDKEETRMLMKSMQNLLKM